MKVRKYRCIKIGRKIYNYSIYCLGQEVFLKCSIPWKLDIKEGKSYEMSDATYLLCRYEQVISFDCHLMILFIKARFMLHYQAGRVPARSVVPARSAVPAGRMGF